MFRARVLTEQKIVTPLILDRPFNQMVNLLRRERSFGMLGLV